MENIFLTVLNISIRSAVLILCVLLIRKAAGKRCNRIMCILWACVAVRLFVPFVFEIPGLPYYALTESILEKTPDSIPETDWTDKISEIPVRRLYETEIASANERKEEPSVTPSDNGAENSGQPSAPSENVTQETAGNNPAGISSGDYSSTIIVVLAVIWAVGMLALFAYNSVSLLRLRKKLAEGTPDGEVVRCDEIALPFVFGVLRPRIYIPSDLEKTVKENVIAHEWIHIRRGDHLLRILWTVVLSVHWFNPMVWVAFWKSDCDMEMSCDDAVTKEMSCEEREEYLSSILQCSRKATKRGYMVGFSAGRLKERAVNIAHPKHAGRTLSAVCLSIGMIILTVSCATAGKKAKTLSKVTFSARTIVCGEDYVAQVLPDGTVKVTMLEGATGLCEIYPEEVETWTGIYSIRAGAGVLYGIDQNGRMHSSSRLIKGLQEDLKTGQMPNLPVTVSQQAYALPAIRTLIEEAELLDGRVFESRRQVMLTKAGTLTVFDLTGLYVEQDDNRVILSEKHVAAYEDSIFLREDGTAGCIDERSAKLKGVEKLKEKGGFCGIAENAISVFGLQENGKVVSGSASYSGIVNQWENVIKICAAGEVVVALHKDGTVSVAMPNSSTSTQMDSVEKWKNIIEISTNGEVIAAKTKDGEVVVARLR
ncbi:MAG: hypothetical protein IKI01_04105 [Lachnospiraceae bacterium]|nr:hypothetical protein [Lachnospiraceae bacterium]